MNEMPTGPMPSAPPPPPSRAKQLILVVDDEDNFLEIATKKLGAAGFDCATAKSETEAVAQAEKLQPDLILMDIHMPGETGTDAALVLRQNARTRNTKIAFLTSLKDPWPALSGDKTKIAEELGMEDYIEKTEDLNVLVQKVQEILARK